ncbi:hypothetical protein EYC80_009732 [Monilinia laxa]|uniref:Transmembrane protein n=1 Tax=Monilinia laxa TaxID=61186 RepID=A0A5N6JYS4_MONLA|nr:hypothetical protein EYC80_009732 [Monilinia laxa]
MLKGISLFELLIIVYCSFLEMGMEEGFLPLDIWWDFDWYIMDRWALLSLLVTLDLAFWLPVCFLSRRSSSFHHITVCLGVLSLGLRGYCRFFGDFVIGISPSLPSLVFELNLRHSSSVHLPILRQAITL